jgi:hypothetical protein
MYGTRRDIQCCRFQWVFAETIAIITEAVDMAPEGICRVVLTGNALDAIP